MRLLTIAFLKNFFRNKKAMFFVLLLPAVLYIVVAFLGFEDIIRFHQDAPYTDFLLAGMIALALMQPGIYTLAYTLVDWRRTGVLRRLFVTPLDPGSFILAEVWARFVIAMVQVVLIIVLGIVLFGVALRANFLFLPLVIFAGSSLFLCFGFLISCFASDYEEAAPYTSVAGIMLTFLGDVFFPAENLPRILAKIADFLPMKPLSSLLRFALLGQAPANFPQDVLVLLSWLLVLGFAARFVFGRVLKQSQV